MKVMLWLAFVLLAGLWTGFVVLATQATDWLLASMASGQVTDLATVAGHWPVPAWLALWVDTAWLQGLQAIGVNLVQWLGQLVVSADGLMGWITPLMWSGWALGMLLLLAFAVAGHSLVGRMRMPAVPRRAKV